MKMQILLNIQQHRCKKTMTYPKKYIKTVAFIFIKDNSFLVEQRKLTEKVYPGKIVIPSGHIKQNETNIQALKREIKEELSVNILKYYFLCSLLHKCDREIYLQIDYYLIVKWTGRIKNNEAEKIFWLNLKNISELPFQVDKIAISEYKRLFL